MTESLRVLLVDDDPDDRRLVRETPEQAFPWMFLGVLFLAWHSLDTKKALGELTNLQGQAVFIQHAARRD